MARNHPPLKLRRGTEAAILAANVSDFEVGEPLFAQDTGKLFIKTTAGTLEEISSDVATWGLINGVLSDQTDLQGALDLKADLAELPQDVNGVIDIAQETTLLGFSSTLTTVQGNLAQTQADLDTAEATLASTAAITLTRAEASSGYLYFTTSGISGVPGTWSIQSPVFADPAVIDGGGADADQGD